MPRAGARVAAHAVHSQGAKTSSHRTDGNAAYNVPRPTSAQSRRSSTGERPGKAFDSNGTKNSDPVAPAAKITSQPSGRNILGIHAVNKGKGQIVSTNSFRQQQIDMVADKGSWKVVPGDPCAAEKFTAEVRAATLIGRAWRKRTRGMELDRKNFVERLLLEDAVCVGITRLLIFVVLFIILYMATLVGIPPGDRRATEIVLVQALSLDDFTEVRTLPAYREEMVKFSAAIKEFSASGSERFPDEEAVIIVGAAATYTKAQALTGLDLKIASEEFTITAWVEITDESHSEKPLLRKPLSTDPDISCWGWYYPGIFHWGAHDFHSVSMDYVTDWQHTVDSGGGFPTSSFNHEAIVVHNHKVEFYRNGVLLNEGGTELPRAITDCDGTIEIGGTNMRLSSVKFYPRPLNSAEIQEINVNGQPLSEIATGSILRHYAGDVHDEIIDKIDAATEHTDELLEEKDVKRVLDDVIADAELSESHAVIEAALYPTDPSPPATLLPGEPSSFLPEHELHEWTHGGSLRDVSAVLVNQWKCDDLLLAPTASAHRRTAFRRAETGTVGASSSAGSTYAPSITYDANTVCPGGSDHRRASGGAYPGEFWSVIEDPLYSKASRDAEEDVQHENYDSEPLVAMNLTGVPDGTHDLTFTFWVKATNPSERFSLLFRVGGYGELDVLGFHLQSHGASVLRVTDQDGHSWAQLAEDMLAASQVEGPLDEKFFITAVNHDPIPTVWRHVAVVFHLEHGYHEAYLDGRLIKTHHWHSVAHIPISSLQGRNLTVAQAPWHGNAGKTLAKVAQFRMYPRALSQIEVQHIQDNSQWPDHTPIKQCHEVSEDTFKDTDGVDHHGRSCSWYHEMMEHTGSNLICTSAAAKAMCPLTCRGERECASGYPFDGHVYDEYHDWLRSHSHKHYRIFDRFMHLIPRTLNGTESASTSSSTASSHRRGGAASEASAANSSNEDLKTLICKGSSLSTALLLEQCNHPTTGNASYHSLPHFYETWEESIEDSWEGYKRADLSQCEELEARIDEEQCGWDDSWVPEFMADVHEMEQFAVQWWARPAAGARLEVVALNMFASLVPPRTLFDAREQNPFQEALTRLAVPTSDGQLWSSVSHRGTIEFVNAWTFYYVKFQKIDSGAFAGQWQVCLAVNGFALDCHHSAHLTDFEEHPGQPFPESFLQGFEVTTEAFLSPLEWSTEVLSVPEVQELYYRLAPKMAKLIGPRTTEVERLALVNEPAAKDSNSFSERLLLAAPPFLYQTRAIEDACGSEAMGIFLEKQLDLINNTHCNSGGHGDICPDFHSPADVYSCKSGSLQASGTHYGQEATQLNLSTPETVFADFLYSVADNDVLVRGEHHDILQAAEFVDRATEKAVILCLFHAPESGDTTVLDVVMTAEGSKVTVETVFSHFGYLGSSDREQVVVWWSIFFALCAVTLLWNLGLLVVLYWEAKEFPDVGWDRKGIGECLYDFFQVVLLVVYGTLKLQGQLASEEDAIGLVEQFVAVPFRDQNESVQNKVDRFFDAVVEMRALLDHEAALQTLGFFTMILMLIRIINATAVHPRTGVLIGTIWHGLNDIWHFAILFMLVFIFSSMVSSWSFGTRPEFEDLPTSMQTQFDMLLGSLPEGYSEDPLLIIYVALTNIVQFFLMLNFLLAIVVESYMKVRGIIEEMQTENEIMYDVGLTLFYGIHGTISSWPNRRRIATLLENRCARRNMSWLELYVLGVPKEVANSMIASYAVMEVLHGQPHSVEMDLNRVGDLAGDAVRMAEETQRTVEKLERSTEDSFADVNRKLEALMTKLGVDPPPPVSRHASDALPLVPARAQSGGSLASGPADVPTNAVAFASVTETVSSDRAASAPKLPQAFESADRKENGATHADGNGNGNGAGHAASADKADETQALLDDITEQNLPGSLNLSEIEDKSPVQ